MSVKGAFAGADRMRKGLFRSQQQDGPTDHPHNRSFLHAE